MKNVFFFFVMVNLFIKNSIVFGQVFQSNYYFFGEIYDARIQKTNTLGLAYEANNEYKSPFALPGGNLLYLQKKLDTKNGSLAKPYKVNLALTSFSFNEKLETNKKATGNLKFEGSFYTTNSYDSITIFPFKYSINYTRPLSDKSFLTQLIDAKLADLQKRLEKYFIKNYGKNYKLAQHVIVKTSDFTPKEIDTDTLYFFQRRVNFTDFSPKKQSISRFAASIFTSMGYFAETKMSADTIYISLQTKVYQIKGMSWAIPEAENLYSLGHEQTHFNITQLIAEKFKQRLKDEALPPTDFDSRIQYLYLEYFRKINKMQEQYDLETQHGLNHDKQIYWEKYIIGELEKFNVKI